MLLLVGCMPQCAYGGQGQLSRSWFCTSAVGSRLRGLELACTFSSLPLWVQYIGFTFFVLFHLIVCVCMCARALRLSCGNQCNLFLSFHHMCFMYYTQAITVDKCLPSNPFWPQCVAFYRCVFVDMYTWVSVLWRTEGRCRVPGTGITCGCLWCFACMCVCTPCACSALGS